MRVRTRTRAEKQKEAKLSRPKTTMCLQETSHNCSDSNRPRNNTSRTKGYQSTGNAGVACMRTCKVKLGSLYILFFPVVWTWRSRHDPALPSLALVRVQPVTTSASDNIEGHSERRSGKISALNCWCPLSRPSCLVALPNKLNFLNGAAIMLFTKKRPWDLRAKRTQGLQNSQPHVRPSNCRFRCV